MSEGSNTNQRVLLTGANGYIGSYIRQDPRSRNFKFLSRYKGAADQWRFLDKLSPSVDYSEHVKDIDVIIHLASSAHSYQHSLEALRAVNVDACIKLAKDAEKAGVKRFIYLSSSNVYGHAELIEDETRVAPQTPESELRVECEELLKQLASETQMEVVIVRSPLVYSFDAPGNIGVLLSFIRKFKVTPFGFAKNPRSFISVLNLVDFIFVCCNHEKAGNRAFVISDREPLSFNLLAKHLSKYGRMNMMQLPIPLPLLKLLGAITGKRNLIRQITSNSVINTTAAKRELDWAPPYSAEDALKELYKVEK
ncbi:MULTISPECIES: NAD-dependent epimerase/dehydratase family protein [unclassified Pseudoalteromonas]|uniref:NAD-dependent epimerase/dehydratase family protein n=1 Tax=unclassified Pseudoalteromonas TaxID=194690 RepID=UPI002097FFE4|nr:NAD-dependent epimerase/dehydratase family protein [Pseudoalteromonas sp. XMcav2-N]MCO7188753.1 NAD-dependent epimerase/dehydratase family protein [Pseudoalteromonas sp. XMcav2-N]